MTLEELGWGPHFAQHFSSDDEVGCAPYRVVREDRGAYLLRGAEGEIPGALSGKIRYKADYRSDLPAVGDWVSGDTEPSQGHVRIRRILPRKTHFSRTLVSGDGRGPASRTDEQVIAANVDVAFLVSGLDGGRNLNIKRLERYLTLTAESGALPVIVLNKADVCDDIGDQVAGVNGVAPGIAVHPVSALDGVGIDQLRPYLVTGNTVALIGASGVGKSSIANCFFGFERAYVGEVRATDRRGRHTTAWRELMPIPGGGLIIDTPGLRDVQAWGDVEALRGSFADIEKIAEECRFRDCEHAEEPGCAVRQAVEDGLVTEMRVANYRKMRKELGALGERRSRRVDIIENVRWKRMSQWSRKKKKNRRRFETDE